MDQRWLVLIHQIPSQPAYLRVKVGRKLARIGAVALKSTVYLLPTSDERLEDFQWVVREIAAMGGEATLLEAQILEGLSDREAEQLFRRARDADYADVALEATELQKRVVSEAQAGEGLSQLEGELGRLERRLEEIRAIDYFGAAGREEAESSLMALRALLAPKGKAPLPGEGSSIEPVKDRVWVTRTGIQVDRIASAWLIRRFVDPGANFKFVQPQGYVPEPSELRFDMFEAEFTHEGDLCTFEVLVARFGVDAAGVGAIAELVHDIDIKDQKFSRPETHGLAAQIRGLSLVHSSDEARLARGCELFDELLAYFGGKDR